MKKELYAEYEKIVTGQKKTFSSSFFKGNEEAAKENAVFIMKYAFEKFLGWNPDDIANSVNMDILKIMKIHPLIKYLQIPDEFGGKLDPKYLAHLLYPDRIYYNDSNLALDTYKRVITTKGCSYPKKFFHDEKGVNRAKVCLSYVLREKLIFSNIEEVYRHFLTTKGRSDIRNYYLTTAFELFETPIDYVHQTLSASQRNEFLYNYYKFIYLYSRVEKDNL